MSTRPQHVEPFGTIGGIPAEDRIYHRIREQVRWLNERGVPTDEPNFGQVSAVLRGLADHTTNIQMVTWAPDHTYEPAATSVGRWAHAFADHMQFLAMDQDRPEAAS